jgi:hypothetical protein
MRLDKMLSDIQSIGDARQRGLAFEDFIAQLFRRSHFDVRKNPGAARPRQTDLLASRTHDTFLIECKWRTSKADIADVASLRDRLRRTHGAVGVLISMPGFSGTAVSEVSYYRDQPILLISGDELRKLANWPDELLEILWRKRQALRVDGITLVDEPRYKPRRRRRSLPESRSRIRVDDQFITTPFATSGGFDHIVFAHEIADIDWTASSDNGVEVDLAVPTFSERDVVDVVQKLSDLGWATSDARWSIQQSTVNWHGFGPAAFVSELARWRTRAQTPEAHHSEQFCYVDNCTGGYYTLSGALMMGWHRQTRNVELSFQLQGIPMDVSPLLQLCRSIGIHDDAYFRPRDSRSRELLHLPSWLSKPLVPIGYVETVDDTFDDGATFVTGIIVSNPFRSARWRQCEESKLVDRRIEALGHLICRLTDFHQADGDRYTYRLTGLESVASSPVRVVRPLARWDRARSNTRRQRQPTTDPPSAAFALGATDMA